MFQIDWANQDKWRKARVSVVRDCRSLDWKSVDSVLLTHWEEHCQECAPPACYLTCSLYKRRADQKCSRFEYGIVSNSAYSESLYGFGFDVQFRKWAKLETRIFHRGAPVRKLRQMFAWDRRFTRMVRWLSSILAPIHRKRKLNGLLAYLRWKLLQTKGGALKELDELVIHLISHEATSFKLILECYDENKALARKSIEIHPQENLIRLPAQELLKNKSFRDGKISLYPERQDGCHLTFLCCDFLKYKSPAPAPLVKCVAWDLDNTLWHGVLVEDGADQLILNQAAASLVKALDQRGILQTIISKNDHDHAWSAVERFGLGQYFLCPAINWETKSSNLMAIADELDFNVNSIAVIDDSPFERDEIMAHVPQVRVYAETEIDGLIELEPFKHPGSSDGRKRRQKYVENMERQRVRDSHSGDYDSFLRSCEIKVALFEPFSCDEKMRCLELLQRTNQLNLTGNRYDQKFFSSLFHEKKNRIFGVRCQDRHGDYGIVGFILIEPEKDANRVLEFAFSCRVARKKVEETVLNSIAQMTQQEGKHRLALAFHDTQKNHLLLEVLKKLPFRMLNKQHHLFEMCWAVQEDSYQLDVMEVSKPHL